MEIKGGVLAKVKDGTFFLYMFQSTPKMRPKTAARLMYLATYLSYDGVYSERKRMAELLGLKRKTFDRFFSEVTDAGMLIKTDDGYTMDRNYFVRGKVEYPLYQSLYQHLGYIFLMMPYVNVQWNIVCHNPLEDHLEVIEPMTLGEFCDAIGYERDNAQRLLDNYRKITFNWKGKQQYFCTFFYEEDIRDMRIVCNPNLFYIGKHIEKVESYGEFCVKGNN